MAEEENEKVRLESRKAAKRGEWSFSPSFNVTILHLILIFMCCPDVRMGQKCTQPSLSYSSVRFVHATRGTR